MLNEPLRGSLGRRRVVPSTATVIVNKCGGGLPLADNRSFFHLLRWRCTGHPSRIYANALIMIGFLCRGEFYSRAAHCRLPFVRSFIPCRIKPAAIVSPAAFIDRDPRDRSLYRRLMTRVSCLRAAHYGGLNEGRLGAAVKDASLLARGAVNVPCLFYCFEYTILPLNRFYLPTFCILVRS